jgi:hypothetical protein
MTFYASVSLVDLADIIVKDIGSISKKVQLIISSLSAQIVEELTKKLIAFTLLL